MDAAVKSTTSDDCAADPGRLAPAIPSSLKSSTIGFDREFEEVVDAEVEEEEEEEEEEEDDEEMEEEEEEVVAPPATCSRGGGPLTAAATVA